MPQRCVEVRSQCNGPERRAWEGMGGVATWLSPSAPPCLLQLAEVRDYHREAEPLGVIAAQEELESEQEDEGLTSDEGGCRLPVCRLLLAWCCAIGWPCA